MITLHCIAFYFILLFHLKDNVAKSYPNIKHLSVWNKFTWLLSQEDKDCLNQAFSNILNGGAIAPPGPMTSPTIDEQNATFTPNA